MSRQLVATRREAPADATVPSHALLVRAGMLGRLATGVHVHGPLLVRVLRRIESIIREELDRRGCQELLLPALQPRELWERSGRWRRFADVDQLMFTTTDRGGVTFGLGPTHEEAVTAFVSGGLRSYRQLPLVLYQIQTKFRDEPRPRSGLLRGREFVMKDAYSFDLDEEGLRRSYEEQAEAYHAVFARCGLDVLRVDADPGAMGGAASSEFMAPAEAGEDVVAVTDAGYAANLETATGRSREAPDVPEQAPVSLVETPGTRTIEEVRRVIRDVPPARMVKTMLYGVSSVDGEHVVAVLCRGDRQVNEAKLARALGAEALELADDATIRDVTGAEPGFAGPVGLPADIPVVADHHVGDLGGFVCGANRTDAHLRDVWWDRDAPRPTLVDLDLVQEGDLGPDDSPVRLLHGIEVGHVFQLGTRYSEALGLTVLDADGRARPVQMGSYGIGVTRVAAAIVEQHHDEQGIVWPLTVAPHAVVLVQTRPGDDTQDALAEEVHRSLGDADVDVVWDDRAERAGVKFNDADLIGFPWRVTVGRDADRGEVELTERRTGESEVVPAATAVRSLADAAAAARPPRL